MMVKYTKHAKKNVVIRLIPPVAGVLLLAFIFLLTTYMAKQTVSGVADETLLYARQTCERYDNYVSDDKTKDLINLQEKAISIAMYEQYGVTIHKDILDAYVVDENLTGVVVTDKAGNCVLSSGEDAQILFEKELKNDSVSQILEHPEKSYMERLQIGEKAYDFAVVAREGVTGLILCYHEVELRPMGVNEISLDTMLSGHQFKMDGMVVITNGEIVLNTNENHVQGQSVVGCPIDITDDTVWREGRITKLNITGNVGTEGRCDISSIDCMWYILRVRCLQHERRFWRLVQPFISFSCWFLRFCETGRHRIRCGRCRNSFGLSMRSEVFIN